MADRPGLFGPIEARGFAAEAVSDAAFVRAMLRSEAALARVEAEAGLVPADQARLIEQACRGPAPDPEALGRAAAATGTPVVPLLDHLRARLPPEAAGSLHRGATSQDIVDTASMLTAAGAVRMILADLERARGVVQELVRAHATTPMAGRTLLQHARPTTFGAKAAGWERALDAAMAGLVRIHGERLAVQLGGPVGILDDFGADPERLVAAFAERLGLVAPPDAWHADRSRVAELAGALGVAAAAISKIGLDLVLLAQTEVGEVTDDDPLRGGSSSMAHKRNPVAAVLGRASATRAPGLVADVLAAASSGEHERGAGAWHAEWRPLRELLVATGSAAAWLRDALGHLAIDEGRMSRNLALGGVPRDLERATRAAARLAVRAAGARSPSTTRPARVHHVADGPASGPAVVLSGSLGSTLAMWDPVMGLADGFRVVRYDLRGHGASPSPPGPYTIDDLGADIVALLDQVGIPRASLVGTSIGAMASMWAAARAPERVERLVVIGSSARFPSADDWVERSRTVLREGTAPVAEAIPPRWVSPSFAASHPEALAGYRAMFAAADPAGYAGCCIAVAGMDLTGLLCGIAAPTLVIVGSEDPSTPPEHSRVIVDGVPDARLVVLDGMAHVPSLERPDEIERLVRDHLA